MPSSPVAFVSGSEFMYFSTNVILIGGIEKKFCGGTLEET
jgi:hypothetical protein